MIGPCHGFSEARSRLTALVDDAQRARPQYIARRKPNEEDSVILSRGALARALAPLLERLSIEEEPEPDGSVTLALEPFGLAANAADRDGALEGLAADVEAFAADFLSAPEAWLHDAVRARDYGLVLYFASLPDSRAIAATLRDAAFR
jgi:hypothetical protein